MSYELTGTIHEIFDIQQKTETFKSREFVLEVEETAGAKSFTNYIKFQATQQRTTVLDDFSIGDEATVHFNIKGTKYEKNGKVSFFNNLDAWKIEKLKSQPKDREFVKKEEVVDDDSDLPF